MAHEPFAAQEISSTSQLQKLEVVEPLFLPFRTLVVILAQNKMSTETSTVLYR